LAKGDGLTIRQSVSLAFTAVDLAENGLFVIGVLLMLLSVPIQPFRIVWKHNVISHISV